MQKLLTASILLVILAALQAKAFGATIHCKFKNTKIAEIQSIRLSDDSFVINDELEIPLEKSLVKCGNFGKQTRLDGEALGYQVILKTCSTKAQVAGFIIDGPNELAADIICDSEITL